MNRSKLALVSAFALAFGLSTSSASATLIGDAHFGTADPTSEGFSANGGVIGGATLGGWGFNGGFNQYYFASGTPVSEFQDPTGYTITVEMGLIGGSTEFNAAVWLNDGISRIILSAFNQLTPTRHTMYLRNADSGAMVAMGTADVQELHKWQLYMNPNGAGTADDVFEMYEDGVLTGSVGRSAFYSDAAAPWFAFGNITTTGSTPDQLYTQVSVEVGNTAVVIPEPASLALVGLGIVTAFFGRRR